MRAEPAPRAPTFLLVAADQVVISGLGLVVSAAFIISGAKTEYAWYSLALSLALLLGGLQNALILTPALTLAPPSDDRSHFFEVLAAHNWSFAVCAGILMGVGVAAWAHGSYADWLVLGGASAVAVLGSWSRELRRVLSLADSRVLSLLAGDAAMVALAVSVMGVLWVVNGSLTACLALTATGLAGLVTGVPFGRANTSGGARSAKVRASLMAQAQWTAPSVLITWGQANSYPIVVAAMVSLPSVADLAASRLLIMPGLLMGSAWARYKLPIASRRLQDNPGMSGRRVAVELFAASMAGVAINVTGIVLAQISGSFSHLPKQFGDVHLFGGPWIAYLIATSFRTAVSTAAQAALKFRQLFVWGAFAAALSVLMIVGIVARMGAIGAPIGLAISELVLGLVIWGSLGKGLRSGEGVAGRDEDRVGAAPCAP